MNIGLATFHIPVARDDHGNRQMLEIQLRTVFLHQNNSSNEHLDQHPLYKHICDYVRAHPK